MKLTLTINKSNAEDCPFDCLFRMAEEHQCSIFNQDLNTSGYYDSVYYFACDNCQRLYEKQQGEQ